MKNSLISLHLISAVCFIVLGCGFSPLIKIAEKNQVETVKTSESKTQITATNQTTESLTKKEIGFRMVTDGTYIYYSQYENPGLRKLDSTLKNETLLAEENCLYLNLADDWLFYVVPDSGIWQIKTDGTGRQQLLEANDVEWLTLADNRLFYLKKGSLYSVNLSFDGASIQNMEADYGAAAAEDDAVFSESIPVMDVYIESFVIDSNIIFYIARVDNDLKIFRMDLNGEEIKELAGKVGSTIFPYNGRLYYLEEEPTEDELTRNVRICSIDHSGNDRIVHFEELSAGGEFTLSNGLIYFTRYRAGGPENFEGNYLYKLDPVSNEVTGLYENLEISTTLEAAGDIIWLNNYSYETSATTDYLGRADGCPLVSMETLHATAQRSDSLGIYVERYGPGSSHLVLIPGKQSACYKLVRTDGTLVFTKMMEPNSQETVDFPSGRYTLKIAKGDTWLGDEEAFGPGGEYSTTDIFTFKPNGTYKITSGDRGDFSSDSMDGFVK